MFVLLIRFTGKNRSKNQHQWLCVTRFSNYGTNCRRLLFVIQKIISTLFFSTYSNVLEFRVCSFSYVSRFADSKIRWRYLNGLSLVDSFDRYPCDPSIVSICHRNNIHNFAFIQRVIYMARSFYFLK